MQFHSSPVMPWTILHLGLLLLALFQATQVVSILRMVQGFRTLLHPETLEYTYTGEDQPKALPLHIRPVSMVAEWLDYAVYNMYADSDWASLFPKGNGWVQLGPKNDTYVLSMFHQLHCLDSMRYGYAAAKQGVLSYPGNGTGVDHHMNHCLTYLREAILCHSDTTLERSILITNQDGKKEHTATGMGMVHKCRDWMQIREYLDQRDYNPDRSL